MFLEDTFAVAGRGKRGELEHCRQVVWELIGFQYQARGRVQALQPEQRDSASARVAVQVVADVEGAAAAGVERLDVLAFEGDQRHRAAVGEEPAELSSGVLAREFGHRGGDLWIVGEQRRG